MSNSFFAFGEMLWDCLPSGRHAGGAPFNVSAHLAQLGLSSFLLSAVGQDALGDELLQVARDKRIDTRFVGRARGGLPTGTVLATVDASGNATYEIVQPVAWDEIVAPEPAFAAIGQARAFVFGSLAARSPHNLQQLDSLLDLKGPVKFFDVNMRRPFAEPSRIIELARRADVVKLNHEEVSQLAAWLRKDTAVGVASIDLASVADACATFAEATATASICVTMGGAGAAFWNRGKLLHVPAPPTTVRDTVGAGDAFMAALMAGLTHGADIEAVLESACSLGAFVASHDGATPLLPAALVAEWSRRLLPASKAPPSASDDEPA